MIDKEVLENKELNLCPLEYDDILIPAIQDYLANFTFKNFVEAITSRVIVQPNVRRICLCVYLFLNNIIKQGKTNSNILLAAPSGTGKTETYRAMKEYFQAYLPEIIIENIDTSQITTTGFKGVDIGNALRPFARLETEHPVGICFLDEFDKKLAPSFGNGTNVNAEVQGNMLKILEGSSILYEKSGKKMYLDRVLFIGMGSFDYFRKQWKEEAVMGFGSVSDKDTSLFKMISRDDLVKFGALYELVGRFPYIINFSPLTEEAVKGVISKIRKKLEDEYECRITLTPGMEESLLKEANSPYGCRIFESMLREGASRGLLKWYEEEMNEPGTHPVITINSMDEVYVEKFEQEEVESNCTE